MNDMMVECLRCKNQEAVFLCVTCESFKQLCSQCDSYVHGLPSKKKHKRNVLVRESKFSLDAMKHLDEEAQKQKENKIKNGLNRLGESLAYTNGREELTGNKFNKTLDRRYDLNRNYASYDQACNKGQINPHNFNINIDEKVINRANTTSSHDGVNPSMPNKQVEFNLDLPNYSKEYLNEMKNIFEKEKDELAFKNSSLQNNLERLKKNFSEQINQLNYDIEEIQKKHNVHLQNSQENSEKRLLAVINEKDSKIQHLLKKNYDLENINRNLRDVIEEKVEEIMNLKNSKTEECANLKHQLLINNEDYMKLKNENEIEISKMENQFNEEKKKLIFDYDMKIEKMISQFEEMKEKMSNLNSDRENDIDSLIENHNIEISELEKENETLKKEIECHKKNILTSKIFKDKILVRDKKNYKEEEINRLNDSIDLAKKDNKFYVVELRMLEDQNNQLIRENENLKIQVSKLDNLVYGRIRLPSYKN